MKILFDHKAAVDRGFDVLITADKRMRKQERISGLPLRVVVRGACVTCYRGR